MKKVQIILLIIVLTSSIATAQKITDSGNPEWWKGATYPNGIALEKGRIVFGDLFDQKFLDLLQESDWEWIGTEANSHMVYSKMNENTDSYTRLFVYGEKLEGRWPVVSEIAIQILGYGDGDDFRKYFKQIHPFAKIVPHNDDLFTLWIKDD